MTAAADEFEIRPLISGDAGSLVALESRCIGAAHWGEASYRDIATNGIVGWAVTREKVVIGFILVRAVSDEMEILNLAVDPDARRKGIAARLFERAIEEVKRDGGRSVFLEVRESNSAARGFYSSKGFIEQGRRKNYYSDPMEDALLLAIHLH